MFTLKSFLIIFLYIGIYQVNCENVSKNPLKLLTQTFEKCLQANIELKTCIKQKAIIYFDHLTKHKTIKIGNGIKLIQSEIESANINNTSDLSSVAPSNLYSVEQVEARSSDATNDQMLSNTLLHKISSLLSENSVQLTLPKITAGDIGRGIESGNNF